jgi:tetratricopeptide (TPR) repeat protein
LPPSGTFGRENPIIKVFKAAGDKDGLLRFYETAIERGLGDLRKFSFGAHKIWYCFQKVCDARGEYPRLISRYHKELAKDDSQMHLPFTLADVYTRIGHFDDAIREYTDQGISRSDLAAAAYIENGDFEGAIGFATEIYELQYNDHIHLGPFIESCYVRGITRR